MGLTLDRNNASLYGDSDYDIATTTMEFNEPQPSLETALGGAFLVGAYGGECIAIFPENAGEGDTADYLVCDDGTQSRGLFTRLPNGCIQYNGTTVGEQGTVIGEDDGVVYTAVDKGMLEDMVADHSVTDLSLACTTLVINMDQLFSNNQTFQQDISSWDVSNVKNMNGCFSNTQFNQPIGNWDVSSVIFMGVMFRLSQFNQDISSWDVSSVRDMGGMFTRSQFNQPIGNWDVSSVTEMDSMFSVSSFNQDLSGWDVSSVTSMKSMFNKSPFNQDISNWDVSSVEWMDFMFGGTPFNQDISGWDVSSVVYIYYMFYNTTGFNQDLSGWDVSSVDNHAGFDLKATSWVLPRPNFT